MLQTSSRLLRLLALLQSRPEWRGDELAARLAVSRRTVREDVARLRALGYPVDARPGVGGGYRLGAGAVVPPLLLDDEEAVAVAVALRTAAGAGVAGVDEAAVRALVKLQQVLPGRLRHRVSAVAKAVEPVAGHGPTVDPEVLTAAATAIGAHERLRFDYTAHDGRTTRREVEPHRLVSYRRRWYLVGWDVDREAWRTYRADRLVPKVPTGPRFSPRALAAEDAASFVRRGVDTAMWRFQARVRLSAPADAVRARLPDVVTVTPDGPRHCIVEAGSDSPHDLALYLGLLDVDFTVLEPPDLADAFARLAERYARASTAAAPG